jgi:hypothetical protein
MTVSAAIALFGAVFAAVAIRARVRPLSRPQTAEVLARSSDPAGQAEAASQL